MARHSIIPTNGYKYLRDSVLEHMHRPNQNLEYILEGIEYLLESPIEVGGEIISFIVTANGYEGFDPDANKIEFRCYDAVDGTLKLAASQPVELHRTSTSNPVVTSLDKPLSVKEGQYISLRIPQSLTIGGQVIGLGYLRGGGRNPVRAFPADAETLDLNGGDQRNYDWPGWCVILDAPQELVDELHEARSSLEALRGQVADLKAKLNASDVALRDAKSRLKTAQDELRDRKAALADVQAKLAASDSALQDTKSKLTSALADLRDREAALQAAEKDLAVAQRALARLQEELSAAKRELSVRLREIKQLNAKLNKAQDALSSTKKELAAARRKLAASTKALAKARRELAEVKQELGSTNAALSDTTQRLDAARLELDGTRTDLAAAEKRLRASESELEKTKGIVTATQKKLEKSERALVKTQVGLSDAKTTIVENRRTAASELKAARKEAKKALDNERRRFDKEREAMSVTLAKARHDAAVSDLKWRLIRDDDLQVMLPLDEIHEQGAVDFSGNDRTFAFHVRRRRRSEPESLKGAILLKSGSVPLGKAVRGLTVEAEVGIDDPLEDLTLFSLRFSDEPKGSSGLDVGVADAAAGQVFLGSPDGAVSFLSEKGFLPRGSILPLVLTLAADDTEPGAWLPQLYAPHKTFVGTNKLSSWKTIGPIDRALSLPDPIQAVHVDLLHPGDSTAKFHVSNFRLYSRALTERSRNRYLDAKDKP